MADEDQRAFIGEQHVFEEVERLHVEIVGRLVHHQEVRGLRKSDGEGEAVTFAARQRADRLAELFRAEQEILCIGRDVALIALHVDGVAAHRGERFPHRVGRVEALARLVLVGHLQGLGMRHRAGIRRDLAEQQAHQRRLAGAVRADNADPVAAQDAQVETIGDHQRAVGGLEGLRQAFRLDHLLAHRLAGIGAELGERLAVVEGAAHLRMVHLHLAQPGKAALVALAPRRDPARQPVLLVFQLRRHPAQLALVLFLDLLRPLIELEIAFRAFQHLALAQPECVGGDGLEKPPVVADHQYDAVEGLQATLQVLNHRDVEMVRRLVQQQDGRLDRKGLRQCRAALLPAREGFRIGLGVDAELHDLGLGHVGAFESVRDIVEHGGKAGKVRLLRDGRIGDAGLAPDFARVRLDHFGDDLHQSRLAGPVAAHQRGALALGQGQRHAFEQRAAAKGEAYIGEGNQGGLGHAGEIASGARRG